MVTNSLARIANDSPFCESRLDMKKLEDAVSSAEAMQMRSDQIERLVLEQGQDLLRAVLQAHFDLRAAQERSVEVEGADGVERGRCAHRLGGWRRWSARSGWRGSCTRRRAARAAPLDAALALPDERYSYEVRRLVAEESAHQSFDEVVEMLEKRTGAHVPKRQVEELTVRGAQDFDAFYLDRLCEPEETPATSWS